MTHRKIAVYVTYSVLLALYFFLIEKNPSFETLSYIAWASLFTVPCLAFFASKTNVTRFCFLALFTIGIVSVWILGEKSFYIAYNSCIEEGNEVRDLLAAYKLSNGDFPSSLGQLNTNLPCGRLLNGTILTYMKTEAGYELSFSDWLATHRANQDNDFIASK